MTLQALSAYFHRPEMEVAKDLGCCLTSLKKLCRSHGIMRWPYRKVRLFTPATRARPWIWPQDSPLCVPDEKIQPVLPRLSLRPSARAADQKSRQKDAEASNCDERRRRQSVNALRYVWPCCAQGKLF
jgi:hypothetical protein